MKKYNKLYYLMLFVFFVLFAAFWGTIVLGSTDSRKPERITADADWQKEKKKEAETAAGTLAEETPLPLEEAPSAEPSEAPSAEPSEAPSAEPSLTPETNGHIIVIDAGHQAKTDLNKEPVAPGASAKEIKMTTGTYGAKSGMEYELTLKVAKRLQKELEKRGYQVIMVRTGHDVNLSQAQRAKIVNKAKADIFVSIHADGSVNSSASGMIAICPTRQSPYCQKIYKRCRKLADCILSTTVERTKAKSRGIWERDSMTVVNWSKVPVTVFEVGFMTNREEDGKLATASYQKKIVQGMTEGIEKYFGNEGKQK